MSRCEKISISVQIAAMRILLFSGKGGVGKNEGDACASPG